jgi:hypothetical protein
MTGQVMEFYFPLLKLQLSWIESRLVEGLDSIRNMSVDVDCRVHNSIGANPKNARKFQAVR